MRIAITGGTGYVGSTLTLRLAESRLNPQGLKFERVDLLDLRPPEPELIPHLNGHSIRYQRADVADGAAMKSLLGEYDFIVHLAALVGYPACNKDPQAAQRANVETTRNVMRWKKKGAGVLFTSTVSNYGEQPPGYRVDENTIGEPTTVYSRTKKMAEALVLAERQNTVFRYTTAFGCSPRMRHDVLIHDFVGTAARGESLSIYESTFVRQFVHVRDMVEAILFAIKNREATQGQLFNVGHPDIEITKRELVERIAKKCPFPFRFENSGTDLEKRNYHVSFKKLSSLGFRPQFGLEAGLVELVEYYRSAAKERAYAR